MYPNSRNKREKMFKFLAKKKKKQVTKEGTEKVFVFDIKFLRMCVLFDRA